MAGRLADSLDRDKYRSIVCLFRSGWLKDWCEGRGLPTFVLPMHGMMDWSWVSHFRRLLVRERVDVIQAHEFTANTYGAALARLVGIPMVATVHGRNYYGEQVKRRIAYRLVSRTGTMVTVAQDLKEFLVKHVGVAAGRVHLIYNGIEAKTRRESETLSLGRTELGLRMDDEVVGVVGSLYPVKGHRYLLEAVPQILKVRPRLKILIVGSGSMEGGLKELVRGLGIQRQVHFLGFRRDVQELLSLIDVFVLPSLSEGLSLALLEAMAAGKVVVATNVGGNPELVVEGETGFLVPPRDAEALASRLLMLLSNRDQARKLGSNGRRRVLDQFTLNTMVQRYEQLYATCLRQPGARRRLPGEPGAS